MRRLYVTLLAFLIATAALAQRDFSKVEIKAEKVAGSVYMLTGAGGNIGASIGDDGIVVIDDQYAPLAPKIEAALSGITDKPVRFIINTHYHGDHTGGNEYFGQKGTIVAHDNVRKRLESGSTARGNSTPPAPKVALPIVTFNDSVTIHLNGEDIRAVHMPHGHTDGDAIIWFTKSNVVHMGDDFFNGMFPFIDIENGGSVKGYIAAIEKVVATIPDDAKVIPGHGPLSDKAGLKKFLDVMKGADVAVESAMAAGKTVEQMKADKVLAQWDAWGQGFIKSDSFIDTIVKSTQQSYGPQLLIYAVSPQPVEKMVDTQTQFGPRPVKVTSLTHLAEPVRKAVGDQQLGDGPAPPMMPLACYQIAKPQTSLKKRVSLKDQFGAWDNEVREPALLCNPVTLKRHDNQTVEKEPYPTHLVLFTLAGTSINTPLAIKTRDQFRDQSFNIQKPAALAEPAIKNGKGSLDAVKPLRCYALPNMEPENKLIDVLDQFGMHKELKLLQPVYFCDPAEKTIK